MPCHIYKQNEEGAFVTGLEDQQNRMREQWESNNEAEWSTYQQEKQERKARDQAVKGEGCDQ